MIITSYNSQQPVDDFGLPVSRLKFSATLATSTDTTLTVPGAAPRYKVVVKYEVAASDAAVWMSVNETAIVPVGASFAASSSELAPVAREVKAGDVLHFITATANVDVSVVFYSLNNLT